MSKKRPRALWLDLLTVALIALAVVWAGWPGLAIAVVFLIVGGAGTTYNGVTRAGWRVR